MRQTEGSDKGADALQRQNDQQLTHESTPRNWIIRNWKTVASVGGLSTAAGGGVALLDWASRSIDDVATALNFFAQNTFSLLIFLAVIVQAVISNRQWRAMKDSVDRTDTIIENMGEQLDAMRREAKATETALIVSNRAYVGVHSLREDFKNDTLFLMLENIGNIPAERVKVGGDVWIIRPRGRGLAGLRQGFDSAGCPFRYEFGKTRLFCGNLKAQVIISILHISLEDKTYIPSVIDGHATMWVTGQIEYGDGFEPGQITEFAFIYIDGEWVVRGIDKGQADKEDGEAN
ncbi:MAG: hypothetical protein LC794_08550 [Acidobacteria bacterium]|nr:hypothetical protein [Acidobacteriota bacterium]